MAGKPASVARRRAGRQPGSLRWELGELCLRQLDLREEFLRCRDCPRSQGAVLAARPNQLIQAGPIRRLTRSLPSGPVSERIAPVAWIDLDRESPALASSASRSRRRSRVAIDRSERVPSGVRRSSKRPANGLILTEPRGRSFGRIRCFTRLSAHDHRGSTAVAKHRFRTAAVLLEHDRGVLRRMSMIIDH